MTYLIITVLRISNRTGSSGLIWDQAGSGWVGAWRLRRKKTLSPVHRGEGRCSRKRALVVVRVSGGGCRVVEVARGANRALAGIGPLKPGGHVPVQMVDGVRVFGVGLCQFGVLGVGAKDCAFIMQAQDATTVFLLKLWPWVEANKNRLIPGRPSSSSPFFQSGLLPGARAKGNRRRPS